jgi:hypothetical protein
VVEFLLQNRGLPSLASPMLVELRDAKARLILTLYSFGEATVDNYSVV